MLNDNGTTTTKKVKVVREPDLDILKKVILCFNSDLKNKTLEWLARNKPIPLEEANLWLDRYKRGRQLVAIVVNDEGDVLGAGHINRLHDRKRHTGIISVTVFSKYRGKGIGKLIYQDLIEQARESGITRIESEPVEQNTLAIELERKLGFIVESVQKRKFKTDDGRYLNCLLMVLHLNDKEELV